MSLIILILILSFTFLKISISSQIIQNSYSEHCKECSQQKLLNLSNSNNCNCQAKNLYLPEYQYKYSRLNELNDSNFNFTKANNDHNVIFVPNHIIEVYEKEYTYEKIMNIIEKTEKIQNEKFNKEKNHKNFLDKNGYYPDGYTFYINSDNQYYDFKYLKRKLVKTKSVIYKKSTSTIKDIISTTPEFLKIDSQICKPQTILFHINNPDSEENLLIKDIRTDLYQIKIFPHISNEQLDKTKIDLNSENRINLTPSINSYLPFSIFPQSVFSFQLLILPDFRTTIKGTLYIEFNDKKVLLVPIEIFGKENEYRISPVFSIDNHFNKGVTVPIKIFNPYNHMLVIKEIMHSFDKIKLYWPNGQICNNDIESVSSEMLQVEARTNKVLFNVKLNSDKEISEYGYVQLRTERSIIIIPVLLRLTNIPIISYPKMINFGLCSLKNNNNYFRIIPLKLINKGTEFIKIGKIYIEYEDSFLQFHQIFNGNTVIIDPDQEIKIGYIIFNGNNYNKNNNNNINKNYKELSTGKIYKSSIFVETNSTENPFIEIDYVYLTDFGEIQKEITGNYRYVPKINNKMLINFDVNIKLNPPFGYKRLNSYLPGEKLTVYFDKFVNARIANPSSEEEATNLVLNFEIENIKKFNYLRYYYIPLRLLHNLYTLIPIKIDDNELELVFCNDELKAKSLSICLKTADSMNIYKHSYNSVQKIVNLDFGKISYMNNAHSYFYLINENESPIKINQIECNNINFYINFENYEFIGENENSNNIKYDFTQNNKNENYSITIYPKTAIKFTVNVYPRNIGDIKGEIFISYNDDIKFIIQTTAKIYDGKINVSPSNYKFEPAFAGTYQNTQIYCRSNYPFPLNIISVTSNDETIIPSLLTNVIYPENKTEILKITFDPSKAIFLKNNFQINMNNILTYREFYLWQEKEKYFNKLGLKGKTEINATVIINTSLDKKKINLKSVLLKPILTKKDEINFGLVQVGKPIERYIEGYNPSDNVLLVKLILASDEFSDIENNLMYPEEDRNLIAENNDLMIFGCTFNFKINETDTNKLEYIIVKENINPLELRSGIFDKNNLFNLLYKYGNDNVKNYLTISNKIFCRYDKKSQNEIIINKSEKNNYLMSHIYSQNFNNEIELVKNMTLREMNEKKEEYTFVDKRNFYQKLISFLIKAYFKYIVQLSMYSELNIEKSSQSFFINSSISEKVYEIQPHSNFSIGPIIFKPNETGQISSTLFIKNNLSILYPIKLKGSGGSGHPLFINYYRGAKVKKTNIYNLTNFVIEIDEVVYKTELNNSEYLTRSISLSNSGKLPMKILNISIDNKGCETNFMKIKRCGQFKLNPRDFVEFDITIKPNYGNYITNRFIYFKTEYFTFHLNVIVIISDSLYQEKNFLWIKCKIFVVLLIIIFVLLLSINKMIILIRKFKTFNTEEISNENQQQLIKNDDEEKNNNVEEQNNIFDNEENIINHNSNRNENEIRRNKNKQNKKKKNKKNNYKINQEVNNNIVTDLEPENIKTKEEIIHKENNIDEDKRVIEEINNNKENHIKEKEKIIEINDAHNEKEQNKEKNIKIEKENNINVNYNDTKSKIENDQKDKIDKNKKNLTSSLPKLKKKKKSSHKNSLEDPKIKNDTVKIDNNNSNVNKKDDTKNNVNPENITNKDDNNTNIKIDNNNDVNEENDNNKDNNNSSTKNDNNNNENIEIDNNKDNNKVNIENDSNNDNSNINIENDTNKDNNSNEKDNDNDNNDNTNNDVQETSENNNDNKNTIEETTDNNYYNNNEYNDYNNYTKNQHNNYRDYYDRKNIRKPKKYYQNNRYYYETDRNYNTGYNFNYNNYNSNYNYNHYNSGNFNNYYYQSSFPKKQITKIKIKDNNVKNLKQLFGVENKDLKEVEIEDPKDKENNSSIKDNQNKEMNPSTFLNDSKRNNVFDFEKESRKSLKKNEIIDNNNNLSLTELSKEDIEFDFPQFNFDFFFDKKIEDNEENNDNYEENYDDYRFKNFIGNINNMDNPFVSDDKTGKLDSLINNINHGNSKKEVEQGEENENEEVGEDYDYESNIRYDKYRKTFQ